MGGAVGAARLGGKIIMAATTVSKDSIVYREFMAKVKELGGWIEGDQVRFPTPYAALQFEQYLIDGAA